MILGGDGNTGSEPMTWQSLPLVQAHISMSNSMKGRTEMEKKKQLKYHVGDNDGKNSSVELLEEGVDGCLPLDN